MGTTDDATTGEYIGYEENATKAQSEALKIGKKSTFTIKKITDGFEVHSKENTTERIFSWNQGKVRHGYYMYKTSTEAYDAKYTRFTYDEATKTLKAKPDNTEATYALGVSKGDVTEIYRQDKLKDAQKAKFCFWKVEKSSTPPQQCNGSDLPKLTSDAVFKDQKCKAGQLIDSSKTCEATCKSGTHGNPVKYTCTDGKWNKPKSIVCKPDKKAICKVDDEFLAKLKKLNAEFKEEKCQKGEIDEDNTCEASCKEHFKGDKVQYTCDKNGKFTAPEEKDIACQNSFGKLGVLGALLCLFALH